MTAELFPTEIRGAANSISYSIANFLMFIAVQSYRGLSDVLGGTKKKNKKFYQLFEEIIDRRLT